MQRLVSIVLVALAMGLVFGAAPPETKPEAPKQATKKLVVVATNTPLACFAMRIGGDQVDVSMPVPAEKDPAFWSPTVEDIVKMQQADLIVLNSAGHEPWRARTTLPEAKVVETAERFKNKWIEVKDTLTHSHGTAGMHSHKGTSFTTWINPMLAIEQAQAIQEALKKARPAQAKAFDENFATLKTDLEDLDRKFEAAIHNQQSKPIVFSHPIYDYLIARYALNGKAMHWEPGEMPSAEEWTKFEALLKEHPAKWMIWEDSPKKETAEKLRSLGVECIAFRTGGNLEGDPLKWFEVQRENAAQLGKVFE